MQIAYEITVGGLTLSQEPRGDVTLLELSVERGVGGGAGHCSLILGLRRGDAPAVGDELAVELDTGRGAQPVFTGQVHSVHGGVGSMRLDGRDGLGKLADQQVERSYEEVSAGFIVGDLIDAVGAEAGEVDEGPSFPRYVLHSGPRALGHVQRLARTVGAEVFSDAQGRIHFVRPQSGSSRHQLGWGVGLLEVEIARTSIAVDSVDVWGEGAAGTDGADKGHWLPTDLTGVRGQGVLDGTDAAPSVSTGRLGDRPLRLVDGAIRSVDAAEDVAAALMQRRALRTHHGTVLVPGLVDVEIGDWVDLVDLPSQARPGSQSLLSVQVRRLWHDLSPAMGLRTRLGF